MRYWAPLLGLFGLGLAAQAMAADISVTINKATQDGTGASIGTVVIGSSAAGATFALNLHGLPPGPHAFHVHQNADCGPTFINGVRIPAAAAGAHWDPEQTFKHAGPDGDGHLGDLPQIQVGEDGNATQTLAAPRILDIEQLRGHALIIQAQGDSYSDTPINGGGGARIACGIIK